MYSCILRYAATVWNLYLTKDILAVEKVQRRAFRLALGKKCGEMEYEDRLKKLKRLTLKTRRLFLSLVECYKIVFGISKLNFDDFFFNLPSAIQPAQTTRISYMLTHQSAIHIKNAFPIRIVQDWNYSTRVYC